MYFLENNKITKLSKKDTSFIAGSTTETTELACETIKIFLDACLLLCNNPCLSICDINKSITEKKEKEVCKLDCEEKAFGKDHFFVSLEDFQRRCAYLL